jgi:ribonuclease P protein component
LRYVRGSGKAGVSRDAAATRKARPSREERTPRETPAGRRKHVLRQRADFEAVLGTGWRLASRNFVLRAGPNNVTHARLGIIAGKKAAARSVDRNRAKRLIREAFRAAFAILGSYDVTIQIRSDLRSELNDSVRAELAKLLESLALRTSSAPEGEPHRQ